MPAFNWIPAIYEWAFGESPEETGWNLYPPHGQEESGWQGQDGTHYLTADPSQAPARQPDPDPDGYGQGTDARGADILRFPSEVSGGEDVPNWLEITTHRSVNNLNADNAFNYGPTVGPKIQILAPAQIVETNAQTYSSADFKVTQAGADAAASGELPGWGEMFQAAAPDFIGRVAAAGGRKVTNPRSEQIYSAPNYRTFSFHWELTPLSQTDANILESIYTWLRLASYPVTKREGTDNTSLLYRMPHEFQMQNIGYDGNGIMSFGRYGKTVITNMSLNYTGSGNPVTFNTSSGAPPFLNMDISFMETTLLHQNSLPIKKVGPWHK